MFCGLLNKTSVYKSYNSTEIILIGIICITAFYEKKNTTQEADEQSFSYLVIPILNDSLSTI